MNGVSEDVTLLTQWDQEKSTCHRIREEAWRETFAWLWNTYSCWDRLQEAINTLIHTHHRLLYTFLLKTEIAEIFFWSGNSEFVILMTKTTCVYQVLTVLSSSGFILWLKFEINKECAIILGQTCKGCADVWFPLFLWNNGIHTGSNRSTNPSWLHICLAVLHLDILLSISMLGHVCVFTWHIHETTERNLRLLLALLLACILRYIHTNTLDYNVFIITMRILCCGKISQYGYPVFCWGMLCCFCFLTISDGTVKSSKHDTVRVLWCHFSIHVMLF